MMIMKKKMKLTQTEKISLNIYYILVRKINKGVYYLLVKKLYNYLFINLNFLVYNLVIVNLKDINGIKYILKRINK